MLHREPEALKVPRRYQCVNAKIECVSHRGHAERFICHVDRLAPGFRIGRVSFYRNFTDKDDILRYYIDTETSRWLDSSDTNYLTVSSPQAYVVFLLEHLYKYRDVIDLMMRDKRMYLLEAEFDKRFRAILTDVADPWHIAFTIGGFYKLFCYWAETGYEKTPQEIAEYVK